MVTDFPSRVPGWWNYPSPPPWPTHVNHPRCASWLPPKELGSHRHSPANHFLEQLAFTQVTQRHLSSRNVALIVSPCKEHQSTSRKIIKILIILAHAFQCVHFSTTQFNHAAAHNKSAPQSHRLFSSRLKKFLTNLPPKHAASGCGRFPHDDTRHDVTT